MRIIDDPEYAGIFYREHEKFMHDPELKEAYEAGYHCGRKEAYKELSGESYGERRDYRDWPPMYREQGGRSGMNYRDDDDGYMERRRRDSRGRYM